MAKVNSKQLDEIYIVIRHPLKRAIIMLMSENEVLGYSQMMHAIGGVKGGVFGYYVKDLVGAGLLKHDNGGYFLTRIGIQIVKVIKKFELIISEFDLSDVNADGVIKLRVARDNW